tara:strand:- start:125 stop:328 length:204 start_codon:yes stop_codon:yes gene_type:complete
MGVWGSASGEDSSDVGMVLINLGVEYSSKGEHDEAIEYYEKALAIQIKTLGPDHPSTKRTQGNLRGY